MRILSSLFVIFLTTARLLAQGNFGGLTGNVVDNTGAIVAGARMVLTSKATNQSFTTESSETGYAFRGLPPGDYRLEVEKPGFKKFIQESVIVLTATVAELAVSLDLGVTTESVTVTGEDVALQTTSPEISTVLQRQTLLDLPIQIGSGASTTAASGRRQPETFIFLTPGVVGTQWGKSINGSPEFGQEVLIDGISAQLSSNPGFLAQTSPPYEAIEENGIST